MSSSLSALLKEARNKAGLTQEQLARRVAGLTADDISRAERGLDVPTDTQLKAIAKNTGITQRSLLDAAKTARDPGSSGKKSSAAKATSTTSKKTAAAKKANTAKPSSASKKAAAGKPSASAKSAEYTLSATEKKLISAYRSASSENKKLALDLLQGKAVEDSDASGLNIGSILQNSMSAGLGGVLETLITGLKK